MIKPTNSNVLVKLLPRGEIAGILIPDKTKRWQESSIECEVVAAGPFAREVSPGDVVVVEGCDGKWLDPELTPDPSEKFRMIDQSDILLVKEAAA